MVCYLKEKIKVSQAALNGESRDENKDSSNSMEEAESTDYSSHAKGLYGFCCEPVGKVIWWQLLSETVLN